MTRFLSNQIGLLKTPMPIRYTIYTYEAEILKYRPWQCREAQNLVYSDASSRIILLEHFQQGRRDHIDTSRPCQNQGVFIGYRDKLHISDLTTDATSDISETPLRYLSTTYRQHEKQAEAPNCLPSSRNSPRRSLEPTVDTKQRTTPRELPPTPTSAGNVPLLIKYAYFVHRRPRFNPFTGRSLP